MCEVVELFPKKTTEKQKEQRLANNRYFTRLLINKEHEMFKRIVKHYPKMPRGYARGLARQKVRRLFTLSVLNSD